MLNIFVQRVPDETGKGKFIRRLTKASIPLGVNYTTNPKGCQALLDLGWWHGVKKDVPRVLRMDGAEDYNYKLMKGSAETADAMIWQNQFCADYLKNKYGIKAKKEFVINNGADPETYKNPIKLFDGYNVIVSGNWRKITGDKGGKKVYSERTNKRLSLMMYLAEGLVDKFPDFCFWIAGETTLKMPKRDRIKALGGLNDVDLSRYIAGNDAMLNLGLNDWCPNSVVECLVAGKPVIFSRNGGGIVELVGECGLKIDEENFSLESIADYIRERRVVSRPDLFIDKVAVEYKNVFEELLR